MGAAAFVVLNLYTDAAYIFYCVHLKLRMNRKKAPIDNEIQEIITNFAISICLAESPKGK